MPSKKRKYNARFPAGRIKKIMQTDEEVGKVAQAVPIIISRTLELFVESLLSKAMQVTILKNAKTLSPSHVKQCILAESRFDFLKDLVKSIPDVTPAEEMLSGESSPNSSRFSDISAPRRVAREDSNSSSSSDVKVQNVAPPRDAVKRDLSEDKPKIIPISTNLAMDLSKKSEDRSVVPANFYQETLVIDDTQHKSVIKVNPTYFSPQPSTSSYVNLTPMESVHKVDVTAPKPEPPELFCVDVKQNNTTLRTPSTPVINIDFSKNIEIPEIKVLDTAVANIVSVPKVDKKLQRQNSKPVNRPDFKKFEVTPIVTPIDIDHFNSGNLQIDEDYDT